uniref:hypothetical protein n=1 Tax=Herbidospora sakaeratensis TaxID=564415 RepID=UPI0007826E33|nr:hypothetical protein [Herbidospora sakaeratensis]
MTTRRWITDRTVYTPPKPAPEVLSELDIALAAIQRVRDLHTPEQPPEGHAWIDTGDARPKCEGCDQGDPYLTPDWPCATIRALDDTTPTEHAPQTVGGLDIAQAAVARVTKLALDMRTWCSPHGVAVQYADDIAKAILGEAGLLPFGEALKRLEAEHRQRKHTPAPLVPPLSNGAPGDYDG